MNTNCEVNIKKKICESRQNSIRILEVSFRFSSSVVNRCRLAMAVQLFGCFILSYMYDY